MEEKNQVAAAPHTAPTANAPDEPCPHCGAIIKEILTSAPGRCCQCGGRIGPPIFQPSDGPMDPCVCPGVGNALDCPQHRREAGYALLYECDSLHNTLAAVQQYARELRQQVEDTIMVAQKDVDADDWITAYHFKTGAIHRLLAKAREPMSPSADTDGRAEPRAAPSEAVSDRTAAQGEEK